MIEQESIKLIFANDDVVYVNLNYLSLIKRFSSNEDAQPRLSTLGSNEWKNTKEKKLKAKLKEAARDLIRLYAQRKSTPGFQYSSDTIFQKELEASFYMKILQTSQQLLSKLKWIWKMRIHG